MRVIKARKPRTLMASVVVSNLNALSVMYLAIQVLTISLAHTIPEAQNVRRYVYESEVSLNMKYGYTVLLWPKWSIVTQPNMLNLHQKTKSVYQGKIA